MYIVIIYLSGMDNQMRRSYGHEFWLSRTCRSHVSVMSRVSDSEIQVIQAPQFGDFPRSLQQYIANWSIG